MEVVSGSLVGSDCRRVDDLVEALMDGCWELNSLSMEDGLLGVVVERMVSLEIIGGRG